MKHQTAHAAAQADHDARLRKARRKAIRTLALRAVGQTALMLLFGCGLVAFWVGVYLTWGVGAALMIAGVMVAFIAIVMS